VEANLDFVEEDIPGLPREAMVRELSAARAQIDELLSTSLRGRLLRDGLRVALVGRPNVGKSSLFNAFLASDRAIVTDVPGTTRDTLEETVQWEGFPVVLTDTAGLRETADIVEREGNRRSTEALGRADVVLFVVDASQPVTEEDRRIAASLGGKNAVLVLNKSDRPSQFKAGDLSIAPAVSASATARTGLAAVQQAALNAVGTGASPVEAGAVVTSLRHIRHLENAATHLAEAAAALEKRRSEEALAIDVRKALDELGLITGEKIDDDVLSSIFRQFCIGK
jgi:tRNA modification GTPase